MKDAIAGTMLVLAMLAFFAIGVAWVALWDFYLAGCGRAYPRPNL